MKKRILYLPIALACAVVIGMFLGTRLNYPAQPVSVLNQVQKEEKIRQIINYVDYEYVDQVNTDSLLDLTIRDMLHRLDPHSSYIAQSDVRKAVENLQGEFDGVGIEYRLFRDTLVVVRILDDGPAEDAGLEPGDRILRIDGRSAIGEYSEVGPVIESLRGESGSTVTLDVFRRSSNKTQSIEIERGAIPINSVDAIVMLDDSIGILKVSRFAETTNRESERAIAQLRRKGMRYLILDLRDNPGGLLSAARKLSDEFLTDDKLIVYTQDREGDRDMSYATGRGLFEEGPLIVLINENTASAAEIVAGALQDNDRAILVGRRSFGKGLVQEEMSLIDGSRVRLTTARYYTPTGRSIQKPYDLGYEAYQREAAERVKNGELFHLDSTKLDIKERFITPQGKVVYGGGGITPDIFVPVDSSVFTNGWLYHTFSYARVDEFAFAWLDMHRDSLKNFTAETFVRDWQVSDSLYFDLVAFAGASNYEKRIDDVMSHFVRQRLKAMIGRNVWGDFVLFNLLYQDDPMVKAAVRTWAPPADTAVGDTTGI